MPYEYKGVELEDGGAEAAIVNAAELLKKFADNLPDEELRTQALDAVNDLLVIEIVFKEVVS